MRRKESCALMMTLCLLLSACGGDEAEAQNADELALAIRTEYLAMEGCTARMEITAEYGDRVYQFTVGLGHVQGGETTLTVVEPEEAAGVTARISGEKAFLEYDGVSLETGPLDESGLSPVGAVPFLLRGAREGFMAESALEIVGDTECLRMTCRDPEVPPGEGIELSLWFDSTTHLLVRGEILSEGFRVIDCSFTDFSMTTSQSNTER